MSIMSLVKQTENDLREAIAAHQKGDSSRAKKLYLKVLNIHPGNFLANNHYGLCLLGEKKAAQALPYFQMALQNKPDWDEAYFNIARACYMTGELDKAIVNAQQALHVSPKNANVWLLLGTLFYDKGDVDHALFHFKKSVEVDPKSSNGYNAIGGVYAAQEEHASAQPWFEKAIEIDPGYANAWNNLAVSLRYQGAFDIALQAFDMAVKLVPDYLSPRANKAEALTHIGRSEEALEIYRDIFADPVLDKAIASDAYSNYLMSLHYAHDIERENILEEHKNWASRYATLNKPKLSKAHTAKLDAGRPLKIGFISHGFKRHPVGYMVVGPLEHLNPKKFECHFYSDTNSRKHDEITKRLQKIATSWCESRLIDDFALAQKIRQDKVDILVDLSGHSDKGRLGMFGYRPAPIQVEWVGGLFDTSGLEEMDWILGDKIEIPEGDDPWYTEKIYRMPNDYICYDPPSYLPDVGEAPALENGYITFGNFNNSAKNNSLSFALWADILRAVPGSKMMFKNSSYGNNMVRDDVVMKMVEHGIEEDRLIIVGGSSHQDHLKAFGGIDIALDPHPYTGGLTTIEALMMGVPVVTWPGDHFAGRHSATHLKAAGYGRFIAKNRKAMIRIAKKWADDLEKLSAVRGEMRAKILKSPLTNSKRFAKDLEKAFLHFYSHEDVAGC